MKKLKLSNLSKNNLNKRQMNDVKGGTESSSAMWPCFCWGECKNYPEESRSHWRMGPRMGVQN